MIHWLVGSLADHPDLARGEAPPELLSPAEEARLGRLQVVKRRQDWILGRWTAKHLVQSALECETRLRLPFSAFTVENAAGGAPVVVLDGDGSGGRSDADALSLSISHAAGRAFCAVTLMPSARVGADIEWIAPRHPRFAEEYFTPQETSRLQTAPLELYDSLVTVIWSAKEAVLKALGLGLTVDTRAVRCLVDPPPDPEDPVLYGFRWSPFAVELDPALSSGAGPKPNEMRRTDRVPPNEPEPDKSPVIAGWWQIMSNYALTLVLIRGVSVKLPGKPEVDDHES